MSSQSASGQLAIRLDAQRFVEHSLLDRVVAGTFSERLFYRLTIIHLVAGAA